MTSVQPTSVNDVVQSKPIKPITNKPEKNPVFSSNNNENNTTNNTKSNKLMLTLTGLGIAALTAGGLLLTKRKHSKNLVGDINNITMQNNESISSKVIKELNDAKKLVIDYKDGLIQNSKKFNGDLLFKKDYIYDDNNQLKKVICTESHIEKAITQNGIEINKTTKNKPLYSYTYDENKKPNVKSYYNYDGDNLHSILERHVDTNIDVVKLYDSEGKLTTGAFERQIDDMNTKYFKYTDSDGSNYEFLFKKDPESKKLKMNVSVKKENAPERIYTAYENENNEWTYQCIGINKTQKKKTTKVNNVPLPFGADEYKEIISIKNKALNLYEDAFKRVESMKKHITE